MKQNLVNSLKKYSLSLTLLTCIAVLIWINAPLLKIGQGYPFLNPMKRIYVIILVFLSWILKYIFIDNAPKKITLDQPTSAEIKNKLRLLEGRFYGAIEFLRKTVSDKTGKNLQLAQLPWFLLMGPEGAGKTTLLANSNINFILSKQFKAESVKNIGASDQCDWWVTRDLVLVDIPGHYLTSPLKDSPSKNNGHYLWKNLLALVNKTQTNKLLQGMVIVLNLPEIIKQERTQKNEIIYDLKKRITDVSQSMGRPIPIHFIITKCDLLPGFTEFFSECSSDEIMQSWGITLDSNQNVADVFSQRFNALIKRINKQLIWRLHQERNPGARPAIKDFPLHLERLKEAFTQLLKALMMPKMPLQSVFLTSSSQEYTEEEPAHLVTAGTPSHFNTQALQILSTPPMPARSYFVKQLIVSQLNRTTSPIKVIQKHNPWKRRVAYAASACAITAASYFLLCDFQQGVQQAYSIQNDLNQYQLTAQQSNQQIDHIMQALPLLKSLQQAANHQGNKLTLDYFSKKSHQTANQVYQEALQTIVLPDVKGFFEDYLTSSGQKSTDNVYAILKAYLMLSDKDHFQGNYMQAALQQVIPAMPAADVATLVTHLRAALNGANHPITLNDNLIDNTRKQLTSLPSATLAFVILKNMGNNNIDSALGLGTELNNPPIFMTKSVESIIPTMYTAQNFLKIINEEASTAAREASQGNWVLGINLVVTSPATIDALAAQLRSQYTENYIDIWETLLENIQLATPKNLPELNNMIGIVTGNTSPLLQFLTTIKNNTSFPQIMAASPKLQSLGQLITGTNQPGNSALYQVFSGLKQLHQFTNEIVTSSDSGKAAFQASASRMQNAAMHPLTQIELIAEQSPQPMKSWLNGISQQTWQFLLQDSARFIETTWQREIMPVYHTEIANHYPFSQNASVDVPLSQFIAFLGQQGLVAIFYQHYLKPFVVENETNWQWRTVDGLKLPFTDKILTQMQYVNSLQKAFFPNGDNKLYVQFALQPISIDSNTKSFSLDMNGQQVSYQNEAANTSRMLAWPGNSSTHTTSYHFVSSTNQDISSSLQGDWGWFRLVNETTKNINSRKELSLTFNHEGHVAKYLLFTQGHMNPFLPLNLSKFELTDQLRENS